MQKWITDVLWSVCAKPNGPLHFGTFVTGLASYLHAKANNGKWFLRIEDIDKERCRQEYTDQILLQLEEHHLFWDGPIVYQSQRSEAYEEALEELKPWTYICTCTRSDLSSSAGHQKGYYPGTCRSKEHQGMGATRILLTEGRWQLHDLYAGLIMQDPQKFGDVVVKRRDGQYSYNLAVTVDDEFQKITHVIRGYDLIDLCGIQREIQRKLKYRLLNYGHVPLVLDSNKRKMSKQNHACALDPKKQVQNVQAALKHIGLYNGATNEKADLDELLDTAASKIKKTLK